MTSQFKLVSLSLFLSMVVFVHAQSTATDSQALSFFDHLLLHVANLEDKTNDLQRRQAAISSILSLSSSEKAALSSAITEYQAGLIPLQQQVKAITAGKIALSSGDMTSLTKIAAQRANLVQSVALKFFGTLSAASMERIHNAGRTSAQLVR